MPQVQKVDGEGVLTLVQGMKFLPANMMLKVEFFNGVEMEFPVENFVDVSMMQVEMTPAQRVQAEIMINRISDLGGWRMWFPDLNWN